MRVLIIKPSSFGDIVQALASADALKRSFENVRIDWVVFDMWQDIAQMCSDIDDVIVWKRAGGLREFLRIVRCLRKTKYDYIFDLQGLLRSAFLAKFAKARQKIGISGMKEMSGLLIKEVLPQNAKINATLRNLETIRFITRQTFPPKANIKIPQSIQNQAAEILHSANVGTKFIAFQPFARGKNKDWAIANYISLAALIKKAAPDFQIVVLGSKKDEGKFASAGKDESKFAPAGRDESKFAPAGIIDLCGKTTLPQLAAVLRQSSGAVGADTGSMHLAAVLDVPSVFIFGSSDIIETSPYIGKFAIALNAADQKDINGIEPSTVFAQIQALLRAFHPNDSD
ncbi:MAG: glycosyltransferase family 9 protein [Elusimicrobiota bacterium]|jgi:ADP-heptose:LPS heptosyltransferase|nr:glycosyltransferase family 9 protein [Elusimicrobiota bacterium]